jgi:L-ascorbate metabolism protein UlaG (beta-lactamase superfamily)
MADYNDIARSGQALLDSIAAAEPGPGEMVFWWCGQQSFIAKFGQTAVFFDPYLQPSPARTKPPMLTPDACGLFDVIVCSHDHSDHIDPSAIPGIAASSDALFVAPRAVRQRMLDLKVPPDRLVGLNAGETAEVAGLTITAVASAHEFLDPTPEGLYPYLGYVVRGNGVSAYHSGDTVWWEGLQSELRRLLPIDVAFVPINGRDGERYRRNCIGNLSFAEAADLVAPLPVGLAVPSHFDMFRGNSEDPAKFVDYLQAKYPSVPYWLGPAGEPVVVSAGSAG